MERRNFIRASVATASGVALAGCPDDGGSVGDDDGNGTNDDAGTEPAVEFPSYAIPAYSAWPPEEYRTNDFVLFGHFNLQHLHDAEEEDESDAPAEDDDQDVLFSLPGYGFLATALWFYLGLWNYPWEGTLGQADEPEGMDTDALTMTEGTFIFHGEYDADVFVDEYTGDFDEREQQIGGFRVFNGREGEISERLAYAVSEDTVVAVIAPEDIEDHDEAVRILDEALDNYVEEARRVVDTDDGEWLFETTGAADMVTGFWEVDGLDEDALQAGDPEDADAEEDAPDDLEDNPVFGNVESFISILVLSEAEGGVGGDMTAARFSALYPPGETPSEDELREELMASDTDADLDIEIDDDRVHVAAEVSDDQLNDE